MRRDASFEIIKDKGVKIAAPWLEMRLLFVIETGFYLDGRGTAFL